MATSPNDTARHRERRRFLRAASGAVLGLPLSLALSRHAQSQGQALATAPPQMARRVIPSTGERLPTSKP
ncbi:MAG TPA: hypothetical protein VFE79_11815 [Paraburkholderia sp.]|jgi:hypothetical protein|nr:hypothetical protein [Paraburkholderia sp.]